MTGVQTCALPIYKPCGVCSHCRKALSGNHPDCITVDDPEKRYVPVELVRSARSDMFVQPNEAAKKVYLFPRGQDMRIESQNALLKVLEEPPSYGVFLLLSDNPEALLPTVRSRCVELNLKALEHRELTAELKKRCPNAGEASIAAAAQQSGGFLGQALERLENEAEDKEKDQAFVESYAAKDAYAMAKLLVGMEKTKRDVIIPILQGWSALVKNALLCRNGAGLPTEAAQKLMARRSPAELMKAAEALDKAAQYAQGNISPGAICGWLLWELR